MKKLLIATLASLSTLALVNCGGNTSSPDTTTPPPAPPPPAPGPSGTDAMTIMVVAVDSLMPEDFTNNSAVMPNINGLATNGTVFTESRSVFSAETIPNHVAMMTGVYPDRNGIPTNNFWDKESDFANPDGQDLDNPNELSAKTLFTWIKEECRDTSLNDNITTAAIMSKNYLYHVFNPEPDPNAAPGDGAGTSAGDEPRIEVDNDILDGGGSAFTNVSPDIHWDPKASPVYIGPGSEHTPDNSTGPESVSTLPDVDFMFVNLGDLDRSSHASGISGRQVTRNTSDQQVGNLVTELQNSGRWDNTLFILVSDHGMDFAPGFEDPNSAPNAPAADGVFTDPSSGTGLFSAITSSISTTPMLDALSGANCGFEPMFAVQNGGTNSIYASSIPHDHDPAVDTAQQTAWERSILAARSCLLDTAACAQVITAYAADAGNCQLDVNAQTASNPNYDEITHGWVANPALYTGNALSGDLNTATGNTNTDGKMPENINSRHENLGDLVLIAGDSFKFSESNASGNPIPGNHGHLETIHNTMIVSGGLDIIRSGLVINTGTTDHLDRHTNQSENIDVAATVAWALGLIEIDSNGFDQGTGLIQFSDFPDNGLAFPDYGNGTTRNGFDGRVLVEAFNTTATPSNCGLIPTAP